MENNKQIREYPLAPDECYKQETLEKAAKSKAFEFSVDYKPFETDLGYREYAKYGFEKGFTEGAKWIKEQIFNWLANKDYLSDDKESILKEFNKFIANDKIL